MELKLVVRARGIISHEDKLLVVSHGEDFDYYALPGGHIEFGEDPKECIKREIEEELGITPEVGRLLYIYTFNHSKERYFVEFFFEITNGEYFLNIEKLRNGTHSHEIFKILWINKNDNFNLLPKKVLEDFKNGNLLSDSVRFIK
ncbi:MAG TPA: NUDIX domain-containing protein [Candidatus Paceibacterota bacterium]|nr:NUDIX domain-containing protein [Candidatus Paceibacterota bacterium]